MAEAVAAGFLRDERLTHALGPHFDALRAIRTRKKLLVSPLWAEIGAEVERVVSAVERADHASARSRPLRGLRAVAWNIQRGADFEGVLTALRDRPQLAGADLVLLSEVDNGMGRSSNRNVARELAEALGCSYAFGVSYVALEDDHGENLGRKPSTLALAGLAVLSRLPLLRVENLDLPELRDKFSSSEKRLGKKRALLVEVQTDDGPLVACACHLDSNASPTQRAKQMTAILDRANANGARHVLVGGDWNTSTYDASGTAALFRDLAHKAWTVGFNGVVDNYMTPERLYDTPVFTLAQSRGLSFDGFNDRSEGTYNYDLNESYFIEKVRRKVGTLLMHYLRYRLRPWNRVCAARLDWFAARGLRPGTCGVVEARNPNGKPVSDHRAIWVELG